MSNKYNINHRKPRHNLQGQFCGSHRLIRSLKECNVGNGLISVDTIFHIMGPKLVRDSGLGLMKS